MKIIAIAGPEKGRSFLVDAQGLTIGREPENSIPLRDFSVSRYHCKIEINTEGCRIHDCGSRNGTFVNNIPIQQKVLEEKDQIRIGESIFVYLKSEDEVTVAEEDAAFDPREFIGRETVELSTDLIFSNAPSDSLDRSSRDLNALLDISQKIHSVQTESELLREVLDRIGEIVPADRIAIVGVEDRGSFPVLHRKGRGALYASRSALSQVLSRHVAILANDILEDAAAADSIQKAEINSLLAVPLIPHKKVEAILYLYLTDRSKRLDEHHLRLATGIAAIASLAMRNMQRVDALHQENDSLRKELQVSSNMIGESRRIRDLGLLLAKIAASDSTVLIRGESGTGKELAARAVHSGSPRAGKPFVVINCAALPENLLESELFGHEKGAFTGALTLKKGKLEIAQGGTVFLDEIGELPVPLQAKLLRLLQEHEFERVGGSTPIPLDARFIAATHQDLEQWIKERKFREDLYYRLNVISVTLPPLRERKEDIPLLASYFIAGYSRKGNRAVRGISREALAILSAYEWPGNIRELENAIERAVVLGNSDEILPADLPEHILETAPIAGQTMPRFQEGVIESKRKLITNALEQADGNYVEAAKLLGLHVNHLHRLVTSLGLRGAGS